ncbi:MAG: FecR domain-containing protein [Chloroflexi bacterium]|nr:FecR domain-containing protein [Chloroflexota bacterium]
MRDNPERLAWIILLVSFFTCVSSALAVPLGARSIILYANVRQTVTLDVQRPPLRVTMGGRGAPVAIDQSSEIPERSIIATDTTAGRLVFQVADQDLTVASVQIYDNTQIEVISARSPRYNSSPLPHKVTIAVTEGRARINVADDDLRPIEAEVETPHCTLMLVEGSYEVKVNNAETEITVRNGQAAVSTDDGQSLPLGPAQRAFVDGVRIEGPLPSSRNLVENGDFETPFEGTWTAYHGEKQEPPATVEIVTNEGTEAARFHRLGTNHAEVGIYQDIDYDVRDFAYLELRMNVQVVEENIAGFGGCGTLSSECPIAARIEYKDIYGTDREWLQGFYIDEPAPDWLIYPWTQQIPAQNWQSYDSGNLMEALTDTPPAIIKRVTLYASGHTFDAMVREVELLAEE